MQNDLDIIKKKYGERMSHLCRELFPTILEKDGLLSNILESNFAPNKFLYEDIVQYYLKNKFKNYIYSFMVSNCNKLITNKTPQELMNDAGYILYECKTEKEVQSFRKYYQNNEVLCTFTQGNRLNSNYVFFAVKKNVADIKRENFSDPKREDEYGISVISIQFSKGETNTLSIKNRYNHTVENPDATFGNNLDNIVEGLTKSFETYYGFNINQNSTSFEIPGYVKANDKRFYKYNYEVHNIYYCPNNIIIDNSKVIKDYKQLERYIVFDMYILDLSKKEVLLYDKSINDGFIDNLQNIEKIHIDKSKEKKSKMLQIKLKDGTTAEIVLDKFNLMREYSNSGIKEAKPKFLTHNRSLEKVSLEKLEIARNDFIDRNTTINEINLPMVKEVGDRFLKCNQGLTKVDLPSLIFAGDDFIYKNYNIREINLPKIEEVGDGFLKCNQGLTKVDLPSLIHVGDSFISTNAAIREINLPKVKEVGDIFLKCNQELTKVDLPSLIFAGNGFIDENTTINEINLPKVKMVDYFFLKCNQGLTKVDLPSLIFAGNGFIDENTTINEINLPMVEEVGGRFLNNNQGLTKVDLPSLIHVGDCFISTNAAIREINLPKVEEVGSSFLSKNKCLAESNLSQNTSSNNIINTNKIKSLIMKKVFHRKY